MKRLVPWAVILALNSTLAVAEEGVIEGSAVSTSNVTARTGKLSSGWKRIVCTVSTHFRTGNSAVEASTSDLSITNWDLYISTSDQYIAFILNSSTGSCSIYKLNPGPTGIPAAHASATHQVTDVGTAVTTGFADVDITVTAGTTCLCTSFSDPSDPIIGCSRSGTTLTITTSVGGTDVGYICST